MTTRIFQAENLAAITFKMLRNKFDPFKQYATHLFFFLSLIVTASCLADERNVTKEKSNLFTDKIEGESTGDWAVRVGSSTNAVRLVISKDIVSGVFTYSDPGGFQIARVRGACESNNIHFACLFPLFFDKSAVECVFVGTISSNHIDGSFKSPDTAQGGVWTADKIPVDVVRNSISGVWKLSAEGNARVLDIIELNDRLVGTIADIQGTNIFKLTGEHRGDAVTFSYSSIENSLGGPTRIKTTFTGAVRANAMLGSRISETFSDSPHAAPVLTTNRWSAIRLKQ